MLEDDVISLGDEDKLDDNSDGEYTGIGYVNHALHTWINSDLGFQTFLERPRRAAFESVVNPRSYPVESCFVSRVDPSSRMDLSLITLSLNPRCMNLHKCEKALCSHCKGKAPANSRKAATWVLDSGASSHFTPNESDFIDLEYGNFGEIQTANKNVPLRITGRGTLLVEHEIQDPRTLRTTTAITKMWPVYFVPGMHDRLLSAGQLLQSGLRSEADQFGTTFRDGVGNAVLSAEPQNSHFRSSIQVVHTRIITHGESRPLSLVAQDTNYDIWHRRLAHPSDKVLSRLYEQTEDGPKISFPARKHVCPACAKGKMSQKPFHQNPERAKRVLELVHSDLFELPKLSYYKYKWVMMLLDDYSSHCHVVLLKQKSEAAPKMIELLTKLMNQTGQSVVYFKTDRGGEYMSRELQKFLSAKGIEHLPSAPRIHQQNGRAEQLNRTLHEKAESMRFQACLPESWWDFAMNTAVHVYNRTPMARHLWTSPYEIFYGPKPNVQYFRVFGCSAYVYLPDEMRKNKLSPRSELMIFLGYDSDKNYIFMRHTQGNVVFVSPHAIFDEDHFVKCPDSKPSIDLRRSENQHRDVPRPPSKPSKDPSNSVSISGDDDSDDGDDQWPSRRRSLPNNARGQVTQPPQQPRPSPPTNPPHPSYRPTTRPPPSDIPLPASESEEEQNPFLTGPSARSRPSSRPISRNLSRVPSRATSQSRPPSRPDTPTGTRKSTRPSRAPQQKDNVYGEGRKPSEIIRDYDKDWVPGGEVVPPQSKLMPRHRRVVAPPNVIPRTTDVDMEYEQPEAGPSNRPASPTSPIPSSPNEPEPSSPQEAPSPMEEEAATPESEIDEDEDEEVEDEDEDEEYEDENGEGSEESSEESNFARFVKEGGVQFIDFLLAQRTAFSTTIPVTWKDLLKLPKNDREKWMNACLDELNSLRERGVYELVDLPPGRRAIKNRWVFNLKSDGRYRSRLVAKGFSQIEGIDFDELFSPVVRYETARLLLGMAALEDFDILSVDVKTAFLYGKLDEEIYMEQPEGFRLPGYENKVWRLRRALYGLKQAGLSWWREMTKSMLALGFKRSKSDAGVYYYYHPQTREIVIAVVYVDDVFFMGKRNSKLLKELKSKFTQRWECRDLGALKEFLGMRITRNRRERKLFIDQVDYLNKVLKRFHIEKKPVATPLPRGFEFVPYTGTVNPQFRQKYQQLVGSLMYLMIGSRPDIAFAVVKLSQQSHAPSAAHYEAGLHVCRYLLGTRSYKLVFDGLSKDFICAFSDSDWGQDKENRRSVTGNFCLIAQGPVSWLSRRQKTVALSSTEAEYMALSDCSRQLVWIHQLLTEVGFKIPIPQLYGDNQGSIFWSENAIQEKRSKHIDIKYHYIREVIEDKKIFLDFVEGKNNPADILTKNLDRILFERFRPSLGMVFN
ncbi:hypothetical protein NP233_g12787 [Leucocoprinus birnbaumii]|uniref:Integrase catalytic domain-containing protein n=1 Tax=Leucocoprinus birnbaumii TaxID=56174 RepID=A0AAD5VE00_9AGAR|nr:hypothetical protein NP233_g12787 [Leucocoprinus birnbaumii]